MSGGGPSLWGQKHADTLTRSSDVTRVPYDSSPNYDKNALAAWPIREQLTDPAGILPCSNASPITGSSSFSAFPEFPSERIPGPQEAETKNRESIPVETEEKHAQYTENRAIALHQTSSTLIDQSFAPRNVAARTRVPPPSGADACEVGGQ